jgi:hypothetical protein
MGMSYAMMAVSVVQRRKEKKKEDIHLDYTRQSASGLQNSAFLGMVGTP